LLNPDEPGWRALSAGLAATQVAGLPNLFSGREKRNRPPDRILKLAYISRPVMFAKPLQKLAASRKLRPGGA